LAAAAEPANWAYHTRIFWLLLDMLTAESSDRQNNATFEAAARPNCPNTSPRPTPGIGGQSPVSAALNCVCTGKANPVGLKLTYQS
jgi:hypothetical protein